MEKKTYVLVEKEVQMRFTWEFENSKAYIPWARSQVRTEVAPKLDLFKSRVQKMVLESDPFTYRNLYEVPNPVFHRLEPQVVGESGTHLHPY